MAYYHLFDTIIAPGVGPIRNIRVRVLDDTVANDGNPVTIYDGREGDPIAADYVASDQNGFYSAYVAQGFYTIAYYDLNDNLLSSVNDVGLGTYGQAEAEAAAAAAQVSAASAAAAQVVATTQASISTAQADIATAQAATATTQAGIATTQAATATTQAGIATTQAGTATTQAGIATTQAATATTQAGIATTQAGIATTQAGNAAASATAAAASEAAAETAEANADAAADRAEAAEATVNASITPIMYGRGAPDAMTGGPNGATYVEQTSGRIYGPKASGAWPTTYRQTTPFSFDNEPATVFLGIGQSNNKGFSLDFTTTTSIPIGAGYEYYANGNGRGSILPLGRCRLGRINGGYQTAICKAWAAGGGGCGIWVDGASGGSSMNKLYTQGGQGTLATGATTGDIPKLNGGTWDLSDPKNLYTNVVLPHYRRALDEIKEAGFNIVRVVFVMSQGEQDVLGNSNQANYESAFRALLTRIKTDFPEAWFLIDAIGTNSTQSNAAVSATIRAAQVAVASDSAYSGWVQIAANLAKDFTVANFSDTLHYNQAAYDTIGAAVAASGLTFTGVSGLYPVPGTAKGTYLLNNLPPVASWYRMAFKTQKNGSFGLSMFLDAGTPYANTYYDTTWANYNDTTQTLAWTYPDATEKEVIVYSHSTSTGNVTFTGTGSTAISGLTAIDEGFPLHTISLGTAGDQVTQSTPSAALTSAINFSDADLYRLSSSRMRLIGLSVLSGFTGHSFTSVALEKLSGLTQLSLNRCPGVTSLDLTKTPNLTTHSQTASGLSVAEVNARLVALDANGKSNGSLNLSQFLATFYPVSPPSGAGATAKTSLIGKGWTVTTD